MEPTPTSRGNDPLSLATYLDSHLLWGVFQWVRVVNEGAFTLGGAAEE